MIGEVSVDQSALAFLGRLEREETALLGWGLADGFFSREELERRADEFLTGRVSSTPNGNYPSGSDLIDALVAARLLWRIPDHERYRTRMAEAVRLFARLRQIFPDQKHVAWRVAPHLVSDYRLLVRPRMFPRRDNNAATTVDRVRSEAHLGPLEESAIRSLLSEAGSGERLLAGFQLRAAARILRSLRATRVTGTVICAGTGSGKTLAFYLPALTALVNKISGDYWTKCLALYPRNELLKDQFREALTNTRRLAPVLEASGRRPIVLAALYASVPVSARSIVSGSSDWKSVTTAHGPGYTCPFVNCPACAEPMAWAKKDIQAGVERLICTDRECPEEITSTEIRLTRETMFARPPDVLFTSTEMLNQRISSNRYSRLLGIGVPIDKKPILVLLDEVHSYEGVHGAHVAFLLRRWRRASQARPHFVGLSATLMDAPRFFAELVGLNPGDVAEVSPGATELVAGGNEYMLALRGDPASGTSLLSVTIQTAMLLRRILDLGQTTDLFGSRVFAFTDNLDVINRLYHNLLDAEGWDSFGRPNASRGSLANLRSTTLPNARERFDVGQNWALVEDIGHTLAPLSRMRVARTSSQDVGVDPNADVIVASSSLEVGFDDPAVGAVLQHKAPHTAAAFLQRKGRAGRRTEMRPWTVVVLSDYGKDRNAYQSYDQLFSPNLPPKHLPLHNRAVLKMQATYSLIDWLVRTASPGGSPDPWADMSQPAETAISTAIPAPRRQELIDALRQRQSTYARRLRALLEESEVREDLSAYLARALSLDDDSVTALLWDPPRALITEAVPTLLRRLERNWKRSGKPGYEFYVPRLPLPEFIPGALFSDLQLPEISIRLPAFRGQSERVEAMPLVQALGEFAPGRVSRRFGVRQAAERHWVAPGNDGFVAIDSFCPPVDRQELGSFAFRRGDTLGHIAVVRPFAFNVSVPSNDVRQSSNSFLIWRTEIVLTDRGQEVDNPTGNQWGQTISAIRFHTHNLGTPIELRRFSAEAEASIGRGRDKTTQRTIRFGRVTESGEIEPVALGFVADVDAINISFHYPTNLTRLSRTEPRLVRVLRPAFFKDSFMGQPQLELLSNRFERGWLADAYFAAICVEALRSQTSLESAEGRLFENSGNTSLGEILRVMLLGDAEAYGPDDDDGLPKKLTELLALAETEQIRQALHHCASALWTSIDDAWDSWVRDRYRSAVGAAILEAARSLCPRMDSDALAIDVACRLGFDPTDGEDEIWLTETTIGGGGFVEEFFAEYSRDPRRFYRFFESALAPSDLESTAIDLERILDCFSSQSPEQESLKESFDMLRAANSYEEHCGALATVRAELSRRGILPSPTLIVALTDRLLRPGTNRNTDHFLANLIKEWNRHEQCLGVEIDARVFALVRSSDEGLERALGINSADDLPADPAAWRYGVLYGMLWPRGGQLRNESLRVRNPFATMPPCDRLLVLLTTPHSTTTVHLDRDDWFDELAQVLVSKGQADLAVHSEDPGVLSDALRSLANRPIDAGALLVYARLIGFRRDTDFITATVELPEAFQ